MALSFAFGGNTGQSYEDLKRKRQFAESMMLRGMGSQPKTAMEGLNSAASSIFGALIAKKAGAQEAAGQEAYNKRRESAFSGLIGQPPGGAPASQPPIAAPDPNSPSVIGDEAMSVLGKPSNNYKPGDRESFVSAMMPHALEASKMTGVDPRLIVAQAAQETGWGAHAPGNNYFGVKSHGQGGGNNLSTTEYVNGQPVTMNDNFRSYGGMRDSAMGYANFLLGNPRYQPMMNAQGLDAQLAALGQSGYATDPNYASSVGGIAKSLPDLMALASDPYASDADRSVFAGLIQQALTPPDPMKGIELQKAQLELAQMQNPQAEIPETLTERKALAAEAGLQPGTPEYQTFIATGNIPGQEGNNKTVAEREALAIAGGLQPGTPEYQQFMLTGNTVGRGANEFGLTPVYGRDKDGNLVVMQLGKDGTAVSTKIPEGVVPDLSVRSEEAARGSAVGKESGQSAVDLAGARITADRTLSLIDSLAADPYLDRMVGPVEGLMPNVSADSRRVQAKMDQLKGTAFLEAYNMLRGGGQITEIEGQKAQDAMFRMQAAQSEEDYRAALADFRSAVETGIAKIEARSETTTAPAVPAAGGPPAGVTQQEWDAMPEEDRALWAN